ncbi:hypothetical protein HKBW3S06_01611, partial [Candidatus Hakubella thermalkaliphila]
MGRLAQRQFTSTEKNNKVSDKNKNQNAGVKQIWDVRHQKYKARKNMHDKKNPQDVFNKKL